MPSGWFIRNVSTDRRSGQTSFMKPKETSRSRHRIRRSRSRNRRSRCRNDRSRSPKYAQGQCEIWTDAVDLRQVDTRELVERDASVEADGVGLLGLVARLG